MKKIAGSWFIFRRHFQNNAKKKKKKSLPNIKIVTSGPIKNTYSMIHSGAETKMQLVIPRWLFVQAQFGYWHEDDRQDEWKKALKQAVW